MTTLAAASCVPEVVPPAMTWAPSVMSARLPVISRVTLVVDDVVTLKVLPLVVVRTRPVPFTWARVPAASSLDAPEQPVRVSPAVVVPGELPVVFPAEALGDSPAPVDLCPGLSALASP
jgi:hypothetical protein